MASWIAIYHTLPAVLVLGNLGKSVLVSGRATADVWEDSSVLQEQRVRPVLVAQRTTNILIRQNRDMAQLLSPWPARESEFTEA